MSAHDGNLRRTVAELLDESGEADNEALAAALMSLGGLADAPVPAPGPALAALLPAGTDEVARRRRLGRGTSTIVGLAVIAGMGLGATGVAASTGGHAGTGSFAVQHLLGPWATGPAAPAPVVAPERQPGNAASDEPVAPAAGQNAQEPPSAGTPSQEPGPAPAAAIPQARHLPDAAQSTGEGGVGADVPVPAAAAAPAVPRPSVAPPAVPTHAAPAQPAGAAPAAVSPAAAPPAAVPPAVLPPAGVPPVVPPAAAPAAAAAPDAARKAHGSHPREKRQAHKKARNGTQLPAGKDKTVPGSPRP